MTQQNLLQYAKRKRILTSVPDARTIPIGGSHVTASSLWIDRGATSIVLKLPNVRLQYINKVRIARKCYLSVSYRSGTEYAESVRILVFDWFHPHVYQDGCLCSGDNEYEILRLIRGELYEDAISLCIMALSQINTNSIANKFSSMSYSCSVCRARTFSVRFVNGRARCSSPLCSRQRLIS